MSRDSSDSDEEEERSNRTCCDGICLLISKLLLILSNVLLLVVGAFMVYLGVSHQSYLKLSMGLLNHGLISAVSDDMFTLSLVCGAVLLLIAIKGIIGGISSSKRLLIWYFVMTMIASSGLLYGLSASYLYADYADDVIERNFWGTLGNATHDSMAVLHADNLEKAEQYLHDSLQSAVALCLALSALVGLAQLCVTVILGLEYLMLQLGSGLNFTGFLCGLLLVLLATLWIGWQDDSLVGAVWLLCIAGTLQMTLSCLGFAGILSKHRCAMKLHCCMLVLIFGSIVAALVVCFRDPEYAENELEAHWNSTLQHFTGNWTEQQAIEVLVDHSASLGGVASAACVMCCWALATSLYFACRCLTPEELKARRRRQKRAKRNERRADRALLGATPRSSRRRRARRGKRRRQSDSDNSDESSPSDDGLSEMSSESSDGSSDEEPKRRRGRASSGGKVSRYKSDKQRHRRRSSADVELSNL